MVYGKDDNENIWSKCYLYIWSIINQNYGFKCYVILAFIYSYEKSGVQLALHICKFCICEFNQRQIGNIQKKYPDSSKNQNYYNIYIIVGIIGNSEMIWSIWEEVGKLYAITLHRKELPQWLGQ